MNTQKTPVPQKNKKPKSENFTRNVIVNTVLAAVVAGVFALSLAPQITAAYNPHQNGAYYRGNPQNKNVALMVNVYWGNEYIDGMLKTLSDENVKLTFFVGGSWAASNPEILEKIHKEGHEIANHGYYHKDHKNLNETRNREEINVTHKLIESLIGVKMNLFAPPSGSFSPVTIKAANDLGYKTVMWTRDTIDWRDKDAEIIYARAVKNIKSGDLILAHPTARTAEALPRILKAIKGQGFKAATVTETLA
jgi:probable sporulation protein (polysaccharide deacetylase family)